MDFLQRLRHETQTLISGGGPVLGLSRSVLLQGLVLEPAFPGSDAQLAFQSLSLLPQPWSGWVFFFITCNLKGPKEFRRTNTNGHEEWKREALRWQVEDVMDNVSPEARLCLLAGAHQLSASLFSSVQSLRCV